MPMRSPVYPRLSCELCVSERESIVRREQVRKSVSFYQGKLRAESSSPCPLREYIIFYSPSASMGRCRFHLRARIIRIRVERQYWRYVVVDTTRRNARKISISLHPARFVRPGGLLAYATCSLLESCNNHQLEDISWELVEERTLWPHIELCDGFFWKIWRQRLSTSRRSNK